jgi:AraC-like DNA-binding protein
MLPFDLEAPNPGKWGDLWIGFLIQALAPIGRVSGQDNKHRATCTVQEVGGLSIVGVTGGRQQRRHPPLQFARTSEHFYVACIHLGGTMTVAAGGAERRLARGDVILLDSKKKLPFSLDQNDHQLLVGIPKAWLESRVPKPLSGTILSSNHPLISLFAIYLAAGFRLGAELSSSAAALYAQHLVDLLVESLTCTSAIEFAPTDAHRKATFIHACQLIERALTNVQLTPELIARKIGISKRSLHRLFAAQGKSVMGYVLDERIKRAVRLMTLPEARDLTITEIAFACGFNSLSHFGRVFAERMGMTPTEWRKQRL